MTCANCELLQQRITQLESELIEYKHAKALVEEENNLVEDAKFVKTVVVKFKDGHNETHLYKDTVETTNESVIASVKSMFPPGTVVNVMIVEKGCS